MWTKFKHLSSHPVDWHPGRGASLYTIYIYICVCYICTYDSTKYMFSISTYLYRCWAASELVVIFDDHPSLLNIDSRHRCQWVADKPISAVRTDIKWAVASWPWSFTSCKGLYSAIIHTLGIQSPCQMMIGVYNNLLSKVFRFHAPILRRCLDPKGI